MDKEYTPHDGGPCPIDPTAWIKPQFRGASNPSLGIRREYGRAWQYVWQHDGADDDIVGYRVEPLP